jgi:enoyl-CoA hydratase/carnithine racemase
MAEVSTVSLNASASVLQLFEHPTISGHVLAEARLNSESTLNSLSLEMIDILAPALARWAGDDRVVAVLLTGAGDRAFSAGGDIQALYRAMVKNHAAGSVVDPYPYAFFEREYRLDYRLHTYAKPVVAIGHGIVMGGGLGIFSAARFRVVTEKSRIALPEITIGLFPDAGATILLGRLPVPVATFIAMTGSHLNGTDAVATGLATHCIGVADRAAVRDALLAADWRAPAVDRDSVIAAVLGGFSAPAMPALQVSDVPDSLHAGGSPAEVAERIAALGGRSGWIDNGIATMRRGCPVSIGVVVEQLGRAPGLAPAEAFRLEMIVATQCADHPDFAEGVRALLIDKDNAPRWQHASLDVLPASYVAEHFTAPWPLNPLHDLEVAP